MTRNRLPRSSLTPELQSRILALVRGGVAPARAAAASGISPSTHYRWLSRGREERAHQDAGGRPRKTWAPFLSYVDQLDQAEAQAEAVLVAKLTNAGRDWPAQLALLERRFPERWSLKYKRPREQGGPAGPTGAPSALDQLRARRQARPPRS